MDENTTSRQIDVPDVAGGARNHRKILQPTTALPEDTLAPQITSISSSNSSNRSTRSSRLRGANHVAVNYDEEKVIERFLEILSFSRFNIYIWPHLHTYVFRVTSTLTRYVKLVAHRSHHLGLTKMEMRST